VAVDAMRTGFGGALVVLAVISIAMPSRPAHAAQGPAIQASPTGFLVHHTTTMGAPPGRVYDALVQQIDSWWSSDHAFSGDARNLSLDARPGGCFCEKLKDGGFVEHMRVIYVAPGEMLRMAGALGPLQASGLAGGLAGSLTWALKASPNGTTVELSYSVGGFFPGGFETIAPAVSAVLEEQLGRFKRFVETGKPA
jgi:uncharacterized protein YndB with AHSA1/START domain